MLKKSSFILLTLALAPRVGAQTDGDRYPQIDTANFPNDSFRAQVIAHLPVSGNAAIGRRFLCRAASQGGSADAKIATLTLK